MVGDTTCPCDALEGGCASRIFGLVPPVKKVCETYRGQTDSLASRVGGGRVNSMQPCLARQTCPPATGCGRGVVDVLETED